MPLTYNRMLLVYSVRDSLSVLGSRSTRRILSSVLLSPDREFYLRELVRATGLSPRSVQVELDRLVAADIVVERRSGNRRYVRANDRHPFFGPLRELLTRGDGLLGFLREALGNEGIDFALVFGSVAAGTAGSNSDIDVLLVGDLGLRGAVDRLTMAQERLGREINPVVWTRAEFEQRKKNADHFLRRIAAGPRIIITGKSDELEGLGS